MQANQTISAGTLASKFRSKAEMYFGFRHYMVYYLPPPRQCPVEFLREVLSGKKRLLKTAQLKSIKVPPLEELSV